MNNNLYLVHCVDTEGPLTESINATFERLKENKNIDLPISQNTLIKLQNQEIDLQGREAEIADYLNVKRLNYLEDWQNVGKMLEKVTSNDFRMKYSDSHGNPYTFSWFVIDIVGYINNPRNKSVGFHSVWDNFHKYVKNKYKDSIGWHFHTVPANRNAVEYNTCWTNNDFHEQSVCRRLIERDHFPSFFRAGGHIERNDLSYWLEQYIPFDFSCRSYDPSSIVQYNSGDINDWRGSPSDWSSYNPCFYDYRKNGAMKRTIFRTLDIDSNACSLTEHEVEKAFIRAQTKPTILAVSTHDRRDMAPEIEHVMNLMHKVEKRFQNVNWLHSNALDAARSVLNLKQENELSLSIQLDGGKLIIKSNQDIFGPQPFLAIREDEDLYYRDNVTRESDREWVYTIPKLRKINQLAVAACNGRGDVSIAKLKLDCDEEVQPNYR